jgi:hypothetical protein
MVREWVLNDAESADSLVDSPETIVGPLQEKLGPLRLTGALVFGRFLDLVAGRRSGYINSCDQ